MTTTSRSEQGRRAAGLFVVIGLIALAPACSSCGSGKETAGDAATTVELSPVPEPDGLGAELVITKPGDTWGKLRELGGGAARLLPQSFGLLVSTLFGLPPTAADAIDPDLPMTGAAASNAQGAELASVVAIHVRNGKELVARLSAGADANYSARADSASGITLLEPKPGKASTDVALGVLGNYLLASEHASDVTKLGPYAARTLPKREPPKTPALLTLKKAALAGPVAARIAELWKEKKSELTLLDKANRDKHGGRTPDFGDPAAAISGLDAAVDGISRSLKSASGARVTLDPMADRLDLRVELDAEPSGAMAELLLALNVGDAAPLLSLPSSTPIAALTRTTRATRDSSAKSMSEGIAQLFGDRLGQGDRDKISHALSDLAQGRGDWETYGVLFGGGRGGLVYRGALSDAKSFDNGAKALFRSLTSRAFAEPLKQFIGDVSVKQSTATVPGVTGSVQRAVIDIKPSAMRVELDKTKKTVPEVQSVEALWWLAQDKAYGAMSFDAVPVLAKLVSVEADSKTTIAGDERVAPALKRVKDAAFVVLVEPLALDARQNASLSPTAPVVASFGKSGQTAFVNVEADKAALDSVVKSLALGRK